MEHTYINQVQPGQTINEVYMVKDPVLRSTTKGDLYIAMYLCDRTGQVNGRMWQATETTYRSLPNPGFVHIKGRSELYQGNLQIVVNTVTPLEADRVELGHFLAQTDEDIDRLFGEVKAMLQRVSNPSLRAVVDAFLQDESLMAQFRRSPAAVKMHHDYLGGLLVHTHNMMRVALALFPFYPQVQQDLVLAAVFLHDMGKTEELSCDMAFTYTDSGQLIGHIVKIVARIYQVADTLRQQGTAVDPAAIDMLCHLILSHHGQYEFGSPKLPAMAEAFMLNAIDNLDAKVNQVFAAIEAETSDAAWTAWQGSLQTRLYRRRIDPV